MKIREDRTRSDWLRPGAWDVAPRGANQILSGFSIRLQSLLLFIAPMRREGDRSVP
jgi:hypothetical protein